MDKQSLNRARFLRVSPEQCRMTSWARLFFCCALFVASAAYPLENYSAIFENAVDAIDFEFDRQWAYTETQVSSEHVWVGRFDPRKPSRERWRLLTVDAREPTEDEIEKYQRDKAHDHSDNGDKRVNAMVEPDSIRLIEETDEFWLFGFNPEEDREAVMDSVDATIRVNKPNGHLEYIDIRNHSAITPVVGVKIAKLITRLTFGPAAAGGPIVPLSTQVEVRGRAYFLITFDEQELTRNGDFEYVGQ
jgi:hypothetical protein